MIRLSPAPALTCQSRISASLAALPLCLPFRGAGFSLNGLFPPKTHPVKQGPNHYGFKCFLTGGYKALVIFRTSNIIVANCSLNYKTLKVYTADFRVSSSVLCPIPWSLTACLIILEGGLVSGGCALWLCLVFWLSQ